MGDESFNPWKWACYALVVVLVLFSARDAYWHRKWQDSELYYLRRDLGSVAQYLNAHPIKP